MQRHLPLLKRHAGIEPASWLWRRSNRNKEVLVILQRAASPPPDRKPVMRLPPSRSCDSMLLCSEYTISAMSPCKVKETGLISRVTCRVMRLPPKRS